MLLEGKRGGKGWEEKRAKKKQPPQREGVAVAVTHSLTMYSCLAAVSSSSLSFEMVMETHYNCHSAGPTNIQRARCTHAAEASERSHKAHRMAGERVRLPVRGVRGMCTHNPAILLP
jgi:hypothetical protein